MVMDREMVRSIPPANASTNGSQQNGSVESVPAVNPHTVGREFVRQYYTLLHEAPNYLYRFYSNNSSFIHGGLNGDDVAITGQANIHQRITELNFRDCRAKILHVDAQSSVADGVVIQVTGELSNNGEAMRRFMQTFVLVPLSTKNYYVHNDIFRYTDEVYGDAVTNGSASRPSAAAVIDQAVQVQAEVAHANVPFAVPSMPVVVPVPVPVPLSINDPLVAAASIVPLPQQISIPPLAIAPVAPQHAPAVPPTTHSHPAESAPAPVVAQQPPQPPASKPVEPAPAAVSPPAVSPAEVPAPAADSPQKQPPAAQHAKHQSAGRRGAQQPSGATQTQPQPAEPPKPKTWASIMQTGGSSTGKPSAETTTTDAVKTRPVAAVQPKAVPQPQAPTPAQAQPVANSSTNASVVAKSGESSWEMDSRQVFVGGIPTTIKEQTLRERVAEIYGVKVVDWRWIRELERGFSCGLLLLDSDEAAAKLIGLPRPHTLGDDLNVNFELKRDFRPPRNGPGPGPGPRHPSRYQTAYTGAGRPPPNASPAFAEREREFADREHERGAPPSRGGPRSAGVKRA